MIRLPPHISYSQVGTMKRCGEQYRLERGLHVPSRPNWMSVGGTAVHSASETWDHDTLRGVFNTDPDHLRALFEKAFEEAIAGELKRGGGFTPEEWRATGRMNKTGNTMSGGPNKRDKAWWLEFGPVMVSYYVSWRMNTNYEIAMFGDTPGIELSWEITLGGVKVVGFIDRVFEVNGELVICDLKTGEPPEDATQLATYGHAVLEQWGVPVRWGFYWMGQTGSSSETYDLGEYSRERLDYIYGSTRKQMELGIFIAKPSNMCSGCGVKDFCYAVGGEKSDTIPRPWEPESQVDLSPVSA